MNIKYAFISGEWVEFLLALYKDKVCFLGLVKERLFGEQELKKQYPKACLEFAPKEVEAYIHKHELKMQVPYAFSPDLLYMEGTSFQKKVWNCLLQIPLGEQYTYTWVAEQVGTPKAVRAVGTAIGKNPISLWIPCHRVVRKNGEMGGYRWGADIKEKINLSEKIWKK